MMQGHNNKISNFWQELKRRKVIHFLIAYLAACFAVIEFVDITSGQFNIPGGTIRLLYLFAAIGLPFVIFLPWIINKKKQEIQEEETKTETKTSSKEDEKILHNLPVQLTSFIGREKEMPAVKKLIEEHRILTLTGAGGCGKTRLAIEVASQIIQDYKDGVWFVDLAPITSENLVAKEIIESLKIQEVPNQAIIDTLIEKIKNKTLLIILDNCEHVLKACSEITGKLIQSAPGLKIIVTSRESLYIKGEQVWRVPSLTLIDPKSLINVKQAQDSEAVMLFTDRARLNNPDFQLETTNVNEVVTICNKLDGIPLALELVASKTRHMNTQMILERFADRFDQLSSSDPGTSKRQQTLQATIEWSYNLLSVQEKVLFTRLAAFPGGFDITAAEEVCSDEQLPKETILEILSRLVDRSLVYTIESADQSMRYNRLETLRQFTHQMLQKRKESDLIRKKHLLYYLTIAEEAYEEQFESQLKWVNQLTAEQDNFLAALIWSSNNSTEEFSELAGRLSWFWVITSQYHICREYLEKAVSISTQDSESHARVLYGMCSVLWYFGELDRATKLGDKCLKIWRLSNNLKEQAIALAWLGYAYQVVLNDFETGSNYGEQALEIARKIDKPGFVNHCLERYCGALVHSKQFEKAKPYVDEVLNSSEQLSQPWGLMSARHYHSDCALGTKKFKEAEKRYCLGIKLGMKYGNDWIALIDMQGVAFALSGQSRWAKCIRLNAASLEKANSIDLSTSGIVDFWDEWIDAYIEGAKYKVGEELTRKYEEEGIAMGFDNAVEYALDFNRD